MRRLLQVEPARIGAVLLCVYAAAAMCVRAFVTHDGVFEPDLLVAAYGAVWGLYTFTKVTPVADPKDDEGRPLTALPGDQYPPDPGR